VNQLSSKLYDMTSTQHHITSACGENGFALDSAVLLASAKEPTLLLL